MHLDLSSLLVVFQIVSVTCGFMFALDTADEEPSFGFWFACSFLCAPLASMFYLLPALNGSWLWAYPVGNGFAALTTALGWIGARAVNGRGVPFPAALAIPVVIALLMIPVGPVDSPWSGALPFFLAFSAFSALGGAEFLRKAAGEERLLRHSKILAAICLINACWYLARAVAFVTLGPEHTFFRAVLGPETSTILLLVMIVLASLCLISISRERALRLAETYAAQDGLTGLLNRREFLRQAEQLAQQCEGGDTGCALMLFDLDHFKQINDTHGHLVGDEVLRAFARIARSALRRNDLLCRYGGEEFAALLPDTGSAEAYGIAERIRQSFASCRDGSLALVGPTTSIGIAVHRGAGIPLFRLLEQADQALYCAKSEGRNRTSVYAAPTPATVQQREGRVVGIGSVASGQN